MLYDDFADDLEDESDIAEHGGDDDAETFMESYSDVLNKELHATTLERSFIRASQNPSNDEEVSVCLMACYGKICCQLYIRVNY